VAVAACRPLARPPASPTSNERQSDSGSSLWPWLPLTVRGHAARGPSHVLRRAFCVNIIMNLKSDSGSGSFTGNLNLQVALSYNLNRDRGCTILVAHWQCRARNPRSHPRPHPRICGDRGPGWGSHPRFAGDRGSTRGPTVTTGGTTPDFKLPGICHNGYD
jgi:hypothetical protein